MAKDFNAMAAQILEKVGGKENITKLQHCVTRLRFEVRDKSKIDEAAIKAISGIMGTKWAGEQFQVIVGADVDEAYDAVCKLSGITATAAVAAEPEDSKKPDKSNMTTAERIGNFMKPLVDSVIPLIGLFMAGGLIKGLLAALTVFGVLSAESGTYTILNAAGDSLFYFFPIFIGFTAGKVFNTNPYMTAAIGASLVYPTILAAVGMPMTFLGIPVNVISYTSTILPVFFASMLASKLEPFFKKFCPKALRIMLPMMVTLAIVVPLTFLIIGPVMTFIANAIGNGVTAVWNAVPALGGALIGGLWQILVMTGLHTGMTPLVLGLLMQNGYDILGGCVTSSMMALAGACLAVAVRTKNAERKETGISAMVSTFLGVTEPGIYGIALPNPKAMISMIIGGAVGGAVSAILGVKVFGFGGTGLLQLPFTFSPDGIMNTVLWAIAIAIAFVVAFVVCSVLLGKDADKK